MLLRLVLVEKEAAITEAEARAALRAFNGIGSIKPWMLRGVGR